MKTNIFMCVHFYSWEIEHILKKVILKIINRICLLISCFYTLVFFFMRKMPIIGNYADLYIAYFQITIIHTF